MCLASALDLHFFIFHFESLDLAAVLLPLYREVVWSPCPSYRGKDLGSPAGGVEDTAFKQPDLELT